MITGPYQYRVTIFGTDRNVLCAVRRIQPLQGQSFVWMVDAVIVAFVEVHLLRRIMHVVLVRRIAGPVTTWRVHLDHHQFVRGEVGTNDVHDLAGGIPSAAQTGDNIVGSYQFGLQLGFGRYATLRNFTRGVCSEIYGVASRKVQAVG